MWQAIIVSTSLPFIIYHIPQSTGFTLRTTLLARMAAQEKVIGVKYHLKALLSCNNSRR